MTARHHEVTRWEGFSDAVFGRALTSLVVPADVPARSEALGGQVGGLLGFPLMLAMVCWIWYEESWFFRIKGLGGAPFFISMDPLPGWNGGPGARAKEGVVVA